MENIDFNKFAIPQGFQLPTGQKAVSSQNVEGVNSFDYGQNGYVGFRFAYTARPWDKDKVKKYGVDGSDTIPVILFYRDKDNQVPIKLKRKMRYEDKKDKFGEIFQKAYPEDKLPGQSELDMWELPIGFEAPMFQEAFERWKQQGDKPGTPINAWRADPGQSNTLQALGIFTVEGFAELSEEAFKAKLRNMPPSAQGALLELHQLAIAFAASQTGNIDVQNLMRRLDEYEGRAERAEEELQDKNKQIEELQAKIKGESPKRGRPKKDEISIVDGEIKGV